MRLFKPNLNSQNIVKLTIAGVGAVLLSAPSAISTPLNTSVSHVQKQIGLGTSLTNPSILLAAAPNDCLNDIAEGFSVETRNYYAGICYTRNGVYYVGHSKNGNGSILLRVRSPRRNVYVARNGQYSYMLDMNRNQLTITLPNGSRVTERVIRVFDS